MAFQYGSIDLGIPNPFKVEGAIRTLQGLLVAGLGASALFEVKDLTIVGGKAEAVLTLLIGVVLLFYGLISLSLGLLHMLRFFVGRGVPTSLARNRAKSEAHTGGDESVAYLDQSLAQMLEGRKILTEVDPGSNPLSRWVCTLAESLLYLPVVYHDMAVNVARTLAQSLEVAVLFALAWFLGYTGLVPMMTGDVLGWTGVLMSLYLANLWRKAGIILMRQPGRPIDIGWKWALQTPLLTMLLYGGLSWASIDSIELPPVPSTVWVLLLGFALLGIVTMGLIIAQIRARAYLTVPRTEVSEYRTNWQESIRPPEVFIHFESIVMANRRYKEAPNRVYRAFDSSLLEQGSTSKGSFDGETIQETQPVCRAAESHPSFRRVRIVASAVGHGLIVLAAALVYSGLGIVSSVNGGSVAASLSMGAPLLLAGLIVGTFGRTITRHALWFWSEVQFESLLIYFQCRGTYTESKLTTGKSVYDSTQSDNLVYRSSLTPWVVATRLVSSWFAKSGSAAATVPRYMLEMHKADADLNAIIAELKQFMTGRARVVGLDTEKDLAAVAQIAEINRQTSAGYPLTNPNQVGASLPERTQQGNQEPPLAAGSPTSLETPLIEGKQQSSPA